MDNQWLLETLANEYRKIGHYDSSVTVRQNNLAPIDSAAIAAMRVAYLRGRDDANSDADAAEQESIEQMEDDVSPSNPG